MGSRQRLFQRRLAVGGLAVTVGSNGSDACSGWSVKEEGSLIRPTYHRDRQFCHGQDIDLFMSGFFWYLPQFACFTAMLLYVTGCHKCRQPFKVILRNRVKTGLLGCCHEDREMFDASVVHDWCRFDCRWLGRRHNHWCMDGCTC